MKNSSVQGAEAVGAVIGRLYTTGGGNTYTIENCRNIGTSVMVDGSYHAGGIVGYINPGVIDINTPTTIENDTVMVIGNEVDLTNGARIEAECHNGSIVSAGGITGSVTMHDENDLAVVFKDNTIKLNSSDQIEASGGTTVYRGYLYGFERSYKPAENIIIPNTDGNRLVLGGEETMIVGPSSAVKDGEKYHIIN